MATTRDAVFGDQRLMTATEAKFAEAATLGVADPIAGSSRVVLKFGGTSVASIENWNRIAGLIRQRIADGLYPVIVHSALAGVSDLLAELLQATERGEGDEHIARIRARHDELAHAMEIDAEAVLAPFYSELEQLTAGLKLVREVSPRMHARIMSLGELMATSLSVQWLQGQGIPIVWRDARELLQSKSVSRAGERQPYLSAICDYSADAGLAEQLTGSGKAILTQGFIAANSEGETVLLGRGGSDTTAAYLAAKLSARRLEIWSDVPGVFSTNPRLVPSARLLTSLHYDEAQEIASTGGSVLHPRAIPPVRDAGIPMYLRCTAKPEIEGTTISPAPVEGDPLVKAISLRSGISLISLEGIAMWHQAGFMADVFAIFGKFGVSVDLVSTSESNVTISIDADSAESDSAVIAEMVEELQRLCRVRLVENCAVISLVGRRIRAILHKIGPALAVFEEQRVYLVSQAANDLNFSFVTDEENGYRLIERLHSSLISRVGQAHAFGGSWEELSAPEHADDRRLPGWWRSNANELLQCMDNRVAAYVYKLDEVRAAAERLKSLRAISRVYYAMKANSNADVLTTLYQSGINLECVSPGELDRVFELFPDIDPARVLFTPNFAAREEYEYGVSRGVFLTLDNLYPLRHWPDVFADAPVFVRLDPGQGRGHHEHVKTAGTHAKFGIPLFEVDELAELAAKANCQIVGIHAHSGSGILDPGNWHDVAESLTAVASRFDTVRYIDLGGGLGVPERVGEQPLDLARLDARLQTFVENYPNYEFWMEPGRYLVAEAGVLLARVTQTKGKGTMRYLGIATGMNSLIRPALYGAYHEIVNLTRLDQAATDTVTIVGPICESADRLGSDRLLPVSEEGDVLLIANAGAYGYVMASRYNLREPADELVL